MKKLLYVLAIASISSFAACNGGEKTEETTPAESTESTTPEVTAPSTSDTTTTMPGDTTVSAQ